MEDGAQTETKPAASPRPQSGFTISRPVIISGLYLLNIATGFSVFVGLVLAYVWRGDEELEEWEQSHFTYLIRTFWISALFAISAFAFWITGLLGVIAVDESRYGGGHSGEASAAFAVAIVIAAGVFLIVAAWFCIRCIISMVKAADQKPMPNPKTWLF